MIGPNDSWQGDARKRLLAHLVTTTRDYSPDTSYEQLKRGHAGPHSVAIGKVLDRWAAMWAADMRESQRAGIELDANAEWTRCIREADAEIGRYMANNHLTRAA